MSTSSLASAPFHGTADPVARARAILAGAYDTLRGQVRRVGDTAGGVVGRLATHAETFVGAKIQRRVKPPIVIAMVVAGIALAAAIIALVRK